MISHGFDRSGHNNTSYPKKMINKSRRRVVDNVRDINFIGELAVKEQVISPPLGPRLFPTFATRGIKISPGISLSEFLPVGLTFFYDNMMGVVCDTVQGRVGHDRIREQGHPVLRGPVTCNDH